MSINPKDKMITEGNGKVGKSLSFFRSERVDMDVAMSINPKDKMITIFEERAWKSGY